MAKEKRKVGRPTVMTDDVIRKLEYAFSRGLSDRQACLYADIMPSTLYKYCKENPEFSDRKELLKDQPKIKAKLIIADNLDTAKWYLERKAAEAIQHRFQVGAFQSRRIMRTESNFVSGQMQQQAYKECGSDYYEYVATLDSRTDEECGALDGKRFRLEDAQPGVNMHPMHPFCRCTTIIALDDEAKADLKRRARDPKSGEESLIPAATMYEQWAKDNGLEVKQRKVVEPGKGAKSKTESNETTGAKAKEKTAHPVQPGNHDGESGHKGKDRSAEIASSLIHSPDYSNRLSRVAENREVSNAIISESRKILDHRNGTLYEDLMFIDTRDGSFITRTDYDHVHGVAPSKRMRKMVEDAPDYTIASIHNHPGSTVPSPEDIMAQRYRKNAYGVVVCHNGDIYKYTVHPEKLNEAEYEFVFARLSKLGYNEKNIRAYIRSAKRAGVDVEVL